MSYFLPKNALPLGLWLLWLTTYAGYSFYIYLLCDSQLIYTLDDPYIHLALAEHLTHGHFGINANEAASPSSSILFPWLLAITEILGFDQSGPFVINSFATALSVWLILEFIFKQPFPNCRYSQALPILLSVYLVLSIGYAIPWTGLEHSLHILAVVLCVRGLIHFVESNTIQPTLIFASICMPLLRFEGFALTGLVVLMLLFYRQYRASLLIIAPISVCLAGFIALMHIQNLPVFPSSVSVKSQLVASLQDQSGLFSIYQKLSENFFDNLSKIQSKVALLLSGLIVIVSFIKLKRASSTELRTTYTGFLCIGIVSLGTVSAHIIAGRFGWFFRYELYMVVFIGLLSTYFLIVKLNEETNDSRFFIGVYIVLFILLFHFLLKAYVFKAIQRTPLASQGIYDQQYQMHRFVTEYLRDSVAVNDLGWVAYQNPNYVLDLWGLGSEQVRSLKANNQWDVITIDKITQEKSITLAIIYSDWFEGVIPPHWCKVAELTTPKYTSAGARVDFYLINHKAKQRVYDALSQFAASIPSRDSLKVLNCQLIKYDPLAKINGLFN